MTEPLSTEEEERLTSRLAQLDEQQRWITSKPTLRAIMREVAEIRWRLGQMSDEEFTEFEDFYEDFDFEV